MRVLVTGATGFIGQNLCLSLAGHEVATIARRASSGVATGNTIVADLREELPTRRLPQRLDAVVHLAQPWSLDPLERERDEQALNVRATEALIRYAIAAQAGCFIYASTGNVYRPSTAPHLESDPLDHSSTNSYVRSKIAGEELLARYADRITTIVVRLFVPYGRGQPARRMIPSLLDRVRKGIPVVLVNGGQPATNPINIRDLCGQLTALLGLRRSTVVNLGGSEVCTIADLASMLARLGGWQVQFVEEESPTRFDLIGGGRHSQELTGIGLTVSLEQGLREVIDEAVG